MSRAFLELRIGGQILFLVRPIDKGNEAVTSLTRAIIDYWNPKYLLLVGIGGGVRDINRLCNNGRGQDKYETEQSSLNIGDVVFSKFIYLYDYRNIENNKRFTRPIPAEPPSSNLRDIAQLISEDWEYKGSKALEGIILTGNAVINDPDYAKEIVCPQFERESVLVFETEAGGVARAIYDVINEKKPSFLVIRSISDFVDDPEGQKTRKKNKELVAEAAAAFAYELIRKITDAEKEEQFKVIEPYLREAKRPFEEKNPLDRKTLKEYYIKNQTILTSTETWNKEDNEIKGQKWNIEDFLRSNKRYIVVGAPFGTGKTSYLKYLAHYLAENYNKYGYVPILIKLGEWDKLETAQVGNTQKTLPKVLDDVSSAGAKAIVLLDGLDEFHRGPKVVYEWITKNENFEKVIITTRLNAGIPKELHFREYIRLLPFTDEQLTRFFRKYGVHLSLDELTRIGLHKEDITKPLFAWMISMSWDRGLHKGMDLFSGLKMQGRKTLLYYIFAHNILYGETF